MAFAEVADEDHVRSLVQSGATHSQISLHYQSIYQQLRGLSARSVRRYCKDRKITRITDETIEQLVHEFILKYGHGYGRKLMQGSIRALLGVPYGAVSQRRVSNALRLIAPEANEARARDLIDRTNPVPYVAPYFGYKCHLDQNEKLGRDFGCTDVLMIDGCSRLIARYAAMPIKNPILIYEYVFCPAVQKYGLWDQVRVDHGKEFVLTIFIQKCLSHPRLNKNRAPYKQTTSTKNNVV